MRTIKRQFRLLKRLFSDFRRYPKNTFASAGKDTHTFTYAITLKQVIQRTPSVENKLFNLRLAASKINETVIFPEQIFSFWKIIGSPEKQYRKSRAIREGKLIEEKGGGLCQISSAIYHISLLAGLEIVERHHHSMDLYTEETRFTPLGTDSTIVYGYKDLRIRNTTSGIIRFQILIEDEALTIVLKSKQPLTEKKLLYISYRWDNKKIAVVKDAAGNILSSCKYHNMT